MKQRSKETINKIILNNYQPVKLFYCGKTATDSVANEMTNDSKANLNRPSLYRNNYQTMIKH